MGFVGTLAWLAVPAILIGATGRFPLLGVLGALSLAIIVPFLPFLQVRYAVEGSIGALSRDGRSAIDSGGHRGHLPSRSWRSCWRRSRFISSRLK